MPRLSIYSDGIHVKHDLWLVNIETGLTTAQLIELKLGQHVFSYAAVAIKTVEGIEIFYNVRTDGRGTMGRIVTNEKEIQEAIEVYKNYQLECLAMDAQLRTKSSIKH